MKKIKFKHRWKVKFILTQLVISSVFFSCINDKKTVYKKENKISNNSMERDSIISFKFFDTTNDTLIHKLKINEKDVLKYLKEFDTLTKYDWNQCFGNFAFGYKGKLINNKKIYNYEINAGGWIYLFNENSEIYLGTKNKKDTINFKSIYFCDEDWD
ncbi:hypothetical protein [Aureivirga marina]|uniref:hypothetical protein n=1 Tax=Aureivirga marina TaxID=1182451 RepID=UPI0018C9FAB6|nr:hypothetical protein [Aureivirga marina]